METGTWRFSDVHFFIGEWVAAAVRCVWYACVILITTMTECSETRHGIRPGQTVTFFQATSDARLLSSKQNNNNNQKNQSKSRENNRPITRWWGGTARICSISFRLFTAVVLFFFFTVKHTHVQWSNPSENLISAWDFLLVVSLSYFFPPTVPLGRCPLSLDGSDWSAQVRQVVIHQKPPSSEEQRKAKKILGDDLPIRESIQHFVAQHFKTVQPW